MRNIYNFDCGYETSFWYVIKDSFGGMDELSSKMRNQVKKCFKTMRVEKISAERLKENGYDVFVEACKSYQVKAAPPTKEEFEERINHAMENEYWGVTDIANHRLVAFCMNAVTDVCCEYRTMKAIPKYQKLYAYYGLIYEMNRYYLEERKLRYVNDGARSITEHSNIQPFLIEKFRFRKAYCYIHLSYNRWLNVIVKCVYPLRRLLGCFECGTYIRQVNSLLKLEEIARESRR